MKWILHCVSIGCAVAALAATGTAQAQCALDFNNHAALVGVPNEASNTFATGPYVQSCSSPGYVAQITVSALNLDHYHLVPEDTTYWSSENSVGFCHNSSSGCVSPADYAAVPRALMNMNGTTGVIITAGGEQFDINSIQVLPGSPSVELVAAEANGTRWVWELGANTTWNMNGGDFRNRSITSITLQTTAKTGVFAVDNIALNTSFSTHQFDSTNSTGTPGGDWAVGQYKANCEDGTKGMNGISWSTASNGMAHSERCRGQTFLSNIFQTVGFQNGNGRLDTSTGDWDSGFVKGECGISQGVLGVAQTLDGKLSTLQCATTAAAKPATQCVARNAQTSAMDKVDWAWGYNKAECADDEMVKGVSHTSTGGVHRILCCKYPFPVIIP